MLNYYCDTILPFILVFTGSASTNITKAGFESNHAYRSSECMENDVFLPLPSIIVPFELIVAFISKVGKSKNLIAIAGFLILNRSFEKWIS